MASNGKTEEIQVCTSWLILKQKNKKGSKNTQLLSQASNFCKFATFPLAKASYMARNTQYGRPVAKAWVKRGMKNWEYQFKQSTISGILSSNCDIRKMGALLLLESFLIGFRGWWWNSRSECRKPGPARWELELDGLALRSPHFWIQFYFSWMTEWKVSFSTVIVRLLSHVQLFATPWTGFPVLHSPLEFAQTLINWVGENNKVTKLQRQKISFFGMQFSKSNSEI